MMPDLPSKIIILLVSAFKGIILGSILCSVIYFLFDKEFENNFEPISLKDTSLIEKAKKSDFLKNKENCEFKFFNKNKEVITIDFSKDIEYMSVCKNGIICTKTLDDKYFGLQTVASYSAMPFTTELVFNYVYHCTKNHK